ncbi:DNA binding protein [Orbilia blumenaviensis]|uniref:DNA binding protein n=1 Tax=Orbilia blumenaviensis TaxID=1796055 RepID=A0AAV9TWM9_9PEZI
MPVGQLQKSRPQRAGAEIVSSGKIQGKISPLTSAPTTVTKLKTSEDHEQRQLVTLEEKQSQKVVQDLIRAAIGCITYLRGLIPEKSFCDMTYGTTANEPEHQTQSSFSSQGSENTRKKEPGTRIKQIQRGYSPEADTLLDLIENGIFAALSKGYLKAFQIAVFLDINHPEIIQEAYTFSINYHRRGPGNAMDIKNVTMSTDIQNGAGRDQSAELLDVAQINRSVRALIRRLIVITQNLDLLPENRYLTIRLYHTSDAPGDWAPPMFTQSTGKLLWFDGKKDGILSDEVFGTMQTGLHTVQVRVTSGKRTSQEDPTNGSDPESEISHPRKRQCRNSFKGAHNFIDFVRPHGDPGGVQPSSHDSLSSGGYGVKSNLPLTGDHDQGYSSTQEHRHARSPTEAEKLQEDSIPSLDSCNSAPLRLGELKLDMAKTSQNTDNSQKPENNQIRCECGGETENIDTIQCDLCDNWQHCECYGFVGDGDPRIGSLHACYTCLLRENEFSLLRQMKSFTIARRVVRCLLRNKPGRTLHDIIKNIGIDPARQPVVTGILSVLIEKDYICVFNPRKVASKRSPNRYKIPEREGILRLLEDNLLDPLVNISHHVSIRAFIPFHS